MDDANLTLRYTRLGKGHRKLSRSADDTCVDEYIYDFVSRPLTVVMRRRRTNVGHLHIRPATFHERSYHTLSPSQPTSSSQPTSPSPSLSVTTASQCYSSQTSHFHPAFRRTLTLKPLPHVTSEVSTTTTSISPISLSLKCVLSIVDI